MIVSSCGVQDVHLPPLPPWYHLALYYVNATHILRNPFLWVRVISNAFMVKSILAPDISILKVHPSVKIQFTSQLCIDASTKIRAYCKAPNHTVRLHIGDEAMSTLRAYCNANVYWLVGAQLFFLSR